MIDSFNPKLHINDTEFFYELYYCSSSFGSYLYLLFEREPEKLISLEGGYAAGAGG